MDPRFDGCMMTQIASVTYIFIFSLNICTSANTMWSANKLNEFNYTGIFTK